MANILLYIIVAYVSGILTFFAPCSLPLVPAFFAIQNNRKQKKKIKRLLLFSVGIALVFTTLGIAAGTFGSFIIRYKWQITFISGSTFILFGILGILNKNPFEKIQLQYKTKSDLGYLIFGGIFGITWSGCIGPVLGFILILAANSGTTILPDPNIAQRYHRMVVQMD